MKPDKRSNVKIMNINPKNSKFQCSGCDYLCSLMTASDAPEPKACVNLTTLPKWRKI